MPGEYDDANFLLHLNNQITEMRQQVAPFSERFEALIRQVEAQTRGIDRLGEKVGVQNGRIGKLEVNDAGRRDRELIAQGRAEAMNALRKRDLAIVGAAASILPTVISVILYLLRNANM